MVSHDADTVLAIEAMAEITGLHPRTITDLMEHGWTYETTLVAVPAFFHPMLHRTETGTE